MRNFILSPNFKNSVKASFLSLVILIVSLNFGCCLNASAMMIDNDFPFWETNMVVSVNLSNDIDDETLMKDLALVGTNSSREIAIERFPEDLAKQSLYADKLDLYNLSYREKSNGVQRALDNFHNYIDLPFGMINCGSYYIEVGSSKKHPHDYDIEDKEHIEINNYLYRFMWDPSSC